MIVARSATMSVLLLQESAPDACLEQGVVAESRALEERHRLPAAHSAILINICDPVPAVEEIYFGSDLSHLRSPASYSAGEGQYRLLLEAQLIV